jgi:hypothetical protein
MSKNLSPRFPRVTVGVLVGFVSLIVHGGASLATSSVQQPTLNQTDENSSPITTPSETAQVNLGNSPNSSRVVGLQQGMHYKEARKRLIQQGWQANLPISNSDLPNLKNSIVKALFDRGYEEIKDCSGTGLGLCRFEFINEQGNLLVVSTQPARSKTGEPTVWRWFIEKSQGANP